jgi:hypothetical protein
MLIFMTALPLAAQAETFRCTDSYGRISYTNTQCPEDTRAKPLKSEVSVLDNKEERQYVERGMAEAKAKLEEIGAAGSDAAGQARAATLAQLNQANSLIQSAVSAKQQLWGATLLIVAVAGGFFFLSRRNRRRQNPPE